MKMIIGLGNPGQTYTKTRHNLGFLVLNTLAKKYEGEFKDKKSLEAEIAEIFINEQKIILCKPQTFMNASGRSVKRVLKKYNTLINESLTILDDADLDFGKIRYRENGSAGGHKGLQSIIDNSPQGIMIPRLRIGIGRPTNKDIELDKYVLQKWSEQQNEELPEIINQTIKEIETKIKKDL